MATKKILLEIKEELQTNNQLMKQILSKVSHWEGWDREHHKKHIEGKGD